MWSFPLLPVFVWAVSNLPSQSTDLHLVFTGDSKLAIGVAVSMHGCLSHCVSPGWTRDKFKV